MDKEKVSIILEKIIKKHVEELDLLACFQHYLVFDEIKLIKKDNKP